MLLGVLVTSDVADAPLSVLGRGTDPIGDIAEFQLAKEVKQGRLV